jgi:queuine/archaeosine tRNA-ribosyltransferase
MGVGTPINILENIALGMFDCVMPLVETECCLR